MSNLKIGSCPNFRDLGGIPVADGRLTRFGKIYRSDCLSKLKEDEIDKLRQNGLTCIIDLRSESEAAANINPLSKAEGFKYYNVPLLDQANSALAGIIKEYKLKNKNTEKVEDLFAMMSKEDIENIFPPDMGDMYISLMEDSTEEIARVFKIMAENSSEGIVFHCTAGKDRTGVIAALLLMLAGACEREVIRNYVQTYENNKRGLGEAIKPLESIFPSYLLRSDPEFIEKLLMHLRNKYKDAENYLMKIGVSSSEMEKVKDLLR